jgi:hypothetical protein
MIIVAPTLNTNSQPPFSNMFLKMTLKLNTYMKDPTFRRGEKVGTKLDPIIKVIVKYPSGFAKSQWIYLNPLPGTFVDPYLLTM